MSRAEQEHREEVCRRAEAPRGARNRDLPVFQRLPEDFESPAAKFREFIQKQDASVGQRDFSRTGNSASSRQCLG